MPFGPMIHVFVVAFDNQILINLPFSRSVISEAPLSVVLNTIISEWNVESMDNLNRKSLH